MLSISRASIGMFWAPFRGSALGRRRQLLRHVGRQPSLVRRPEVGYRYGLVVRQGQRIGARHPDDGHGNALRRGAVKNFGCGLAVDGDDVAALVLTEQEGV